MGKLPLFVALDVDDEKQAWSFVERLSPYVLGFKVGPRLYFKSSTDFIRKLSQKTKVFLDFKFYDIPSTMEASVRAGFEMGASFLTVHASAGIEALSLLSKIEKEYSACVLAVTVLTSKKNLKDENNVLKLAEDVYRSGLKGLVSSAHEAGELRKRYPDFFILTPGIRVKGALENEDQSRIADPEFALRKGASALVMGRPILSAEDPVLFVKEIQRSLQ